MGIQDRDYYRDGAGGFLDAWGRLGATGWIILVTSVVFFLQCVSGPPGRSELTAAGAYNPERVLQGEVWRLFTPMLLHAGLWHLFCNMIAVYFAGTKLEEIYGPREFLAFYVAAGVLAQTLYFGLYVAGLVPFALTIGASGAVTAVLVVFAFHFAHQKVLLYFVIPMPMWAFVILFVGLDVLGVLGAGNGGIAYWVHLGGALCGLLYYQTGIRLLGTGARARRASGRAERPAFPVVPAEPAEPEDAGEPVGAAVESLPRPREATDEHLEAKLDQVLAKVSKYGQESLTPEEREILFKASELYKKRRK